MIEDPMEVKYQHIIVIQTQNNNKHNHFNYFTGIINAKETTVVKMLSLSRFYKGAMT